MGTLLRRGERRCVSSASSDQWGWRWPVGLGARVLTTFSFVVDAADVGIDQGVADGMMAGSDSSVHVQLTHIVCPGEELADSDVRVAFSARTPGSCRRAASGPGQQERPSLRPRRRRDY